MKYTLQEGSFSLFPAAWQDNSMNIIRDDESGLSVVVSRGVIPDGSDYRWVSGAKRASNFLPC